MKPNFLKNSFFPQRQMSGIIQIISNSESVAFSKSNILKFTRPKPNSIYNCHNPKGIRIITRLRLDLNHLWEHKFKHSFQDFLNPLCLCGNNIETSSHYLLHCPKYSNERKTLLNEIKNINFGLLELSGTIMTKTLFFGDSSLSDKYFYEQSYFQIQQLSIL